MLKKSASGASRSAASAADGTSIMTPTGTAGAARRAQGGGRRRDGAACRLQLLHARDEREHDPQRPVRGRAEERAELRLEDLFEAEAQTDSAQAERRPARCLVAAPLGLTDVERPHRHAARS